MDFGDEIPTPIVIVEPVVQFRHVHGEIFGRILIENQCEGCPIIYRLKAHATNKFRVRKALGIIEAGGVASIHVDINPTTNPSKVHSEVLHVLVTPISITMFPFLHFPSPERPQSGLAYNNILKRLWKDLRDRGVQYESHMLTCAVDENVILGAVATANGLIHDPFDRTNFSYGMNMDFEHQESREMRRLESMMSAWANCTNNLHDKVDGMQRNVWRLIMFIMVMMTVVCVTMVKNKIHQGVSYAILLNDSSMDPGLQEFIKGFSKEFGHGQAAISHQGDNPSPVQNSE